MNREQDPRDPISSDSSDVIDDWVSGKETCLEDYGNSDWMALDPPSGNIMLLGSSTDEAEDLGAGDRSCLPQKLFWILVFLIKLSVLITVQDLMIMRFSIE